MTVLAVADLDCPDPQQELKSSGCMDPCHLLRGLQQGVGGGGQSGAARGELGGTSISKDLEARGDLSRCGGQGGGGSRKSPQVASNNKSLF